MVKLPEKVRDKMESSQPDDLILVKAAFAATFAFVGKKVAVFVYDYVKNRHPQEEPEPEDPPQEL